MKTHPFLETLVFCVACWAGLVSVFWHWGALGGVLVIGAATLVVVALVRLAAALLPDEHPFD